MSRDRTGDTGGRPPTHLSRRIALPPCQWHAQEDGDGPLVLLLHGAGSSTHTWRHLLPELAATHRVVALDLPGQGLTRCAARHRFGLAGMTRQIMALCTQEGWAPAAIVGHSAGGAIALQMALETGADAAPPDVVGINPALARFAGPAGMLFPLLARALAATPVPAALLTLGGVPRGRARRIIESTGSELPEEGVDLYARLMADRDHVAGTLAMMAQWDVGPLADRLGEIRSRCLFIAGDRDRAVPPEVARDAARRIPDARLRRLGGGHLVHEEYPAATAEIILRFLSETRAPGTPA